MIVLIVVIGICVEIFSPKIDPIDNQATRSRDFVRLIRVTDDKGNGVRVRYITKKAVTPARLDEIQRRPYITDSLNKLIRTAPQVFGDMLLTDIYDFADYAVKFDPPDIEIYHIFVCGPDKEKLYIGENPKIKNWAKWIHPGTHQGLLYLENKDIYTNSIGRHKVYRYYQCYGIHQISRTDEHFSHFSEDERIY